MSAPPYMKLFWGDYHKATRHLTTAQHGAYFLLIGEAWRLGGSLPDDDALLAKWALCTASDWAEMRSTILAFFTLRRGKWTHDRVREELAHYESTSRKRKEAGKRGGSASGGKIKENRQAIADQLATKPEPEPEPERDTAEKPPKPPKPPKRPKPAARPPEFEEAWKASTDIMRKRSSRDLAFAEWENISPSRVAPDALVAAIRRYRANDPDVQRTGGPGLHLWLKWGKWENWLHAPTPIDDFRPARLLQG